MSESMSIAGVLDEDTGGPGWAGLGIELWSLAEDNPCLLAAAETDAAGRFALALLPRQLPPADDGRWRLELRVRDRGTLLLAEVREVSAQVPTAVLRVSMPPGAKPEPRDAHDAPLPTARGAPADTAVRPVVATLPAPASGAGGEPAQAAQASAGAGPESAETLAEPDLEVSELRLLERFLSEPQPPTAEDPASAESIDALADDRADDFDTDWESATDRPMAESGILALWQGAQALAAETGLPMALFYALGASGLPLDLPALLDVPVPAMREAVLRAIADGVVDGDLRDLLDPALERLAAAVRERALAALAAGEAAEAGLGEVLACADLPAETLDAVLARYQARDGTSLDFWEDLTTGAGAAEALDSEVSAALELSAELSGLVGADPPLIKHLLAERRQGRWRTPADLAERDFDDWCDLIESLAGDARPPAGDASTEADQSGWEGADPWGDLGTCDADGDAAAWGDDPAVGYGTDEEPADQDGGPEDWVETRARAIVDTLEETFPGVFLQRAARRSELLGEETRRLLARLPLQDSSGQSIRALLAQEPGLFEDLDADGAAAALAEVEALERVSRVTHRAEEVLLLVGSGLGSAQAIAAEPRRQFIASYAEALGGRPQAARVHDQAQQVAATNMLALMRLLQALQPAPLALGGSVAADRALKDIPDAQALFGSLGFCTCEHCRSVYSPAAYLVDLLRYLDMPDADRVRAIEQSLRRRGAPVPEYQRLRQPPLQVLLARRPDLADLPLTCANTQTPLPYIDLVNELLEAHVTGRSATHDTGDTPADVLKAVPQHRDRDAYARLREAVHPLTLPFHEPLAVARAYLGHLGVSRLDLLRTFARPDSNPGVRLAETLGLSPEELLLIATPTVEPWRQLGFAAEQEGGRPYLEILTRVPELLERAGIGLTELSALLGTRFLNEDAGIKLVMPSPDCDLERVRIAGLDELKLSRLLRLLRLRRRVGLGPLDLDRALFALGARDLDAAVLGRIAALQDLARLLDRPIPDLLALWATLDTFGEDNRFDRLLQNRAVAWRLADTDSFRLADDRRELARTGASLDPVAPALLAAFRIDNQDLSQARALQERLTGSPPRLDLAGLSAIYRIAFLARALGLRIDQLDGLLRLTPADANPFRPADPAATRRFVRIVKTVQGSGFTPEQLVYLYSPGPPLRPDPAPGEVQIQTVLGAISRGLIDAEAETARPAEVTAAVLRQKLALYLDPPLLDPALAVLDPRSRLEPERRRQFFDRHLASLFPDPEAAARALLAAPVPAAPLSAPAAPPAPSPPAQEEAAAPGTPNATAAATPAAASAQPAAAPAAAAAAAPQAASAAERHWQANVERVLDRLLPVLRVRQMRGAVVRALGDALGTDGRITGRLVDGLLRSQRVPGRPLLEDFLALLGTGLTGAYFDNPELTGEPVLTRIDPRLDFAWIGAAPAPGLPGVGFGVRWRGRFAPRARAAHRFYVASDGAVRLALVVDGSERVLLDEQGEGGRVVEHVSAPLALEPGRLYELQLDYRNRRGAASLSVQYGTAPDSKQAIPTADLYPSDGLAEFAPVALAYRRLHKAALLLTGLGIADEELVWLTGPRGYLDLDALPIGPASAETAVASFARWRQLAALAGLRKRLPRGGDLFAVLRAEGLPAAAAALVAATGWDRGVVEALLGPRGFAVEPAALALPAAPETEPFLLRLERAVDIQRRVGVAAETLFAWAGLAADEDLAASVVQTVKARYDEKRWLEVARQLNDPLRNARRDALVAYLLPRLRPQGVKTRAQLFEYLLIDVEMNPCMLTSRVKQAISAVQTFYQRCLLNLEPAVNPRLIDEADWKWMKSYRVWEANRKVFLYPENWIEPELRDDKSPEFKALERTILQQEIDKDNVESAFIDYLKRLDEIARLDVRAVWFERRASQAPARRPPGRMAPPASPWQDGIYHIFARTFAAPYLWFYRRLERGRVWTPWEKVDADIEGDHLVPVVFQNRMHLFWTLFRENSKPAPEPQKDAAPFTLGKDWEIGLAYAVYDRGRWTRKRLSSSNVVDRLQFFSPPGTDKRDAPPRIEGSTWLPTAAYTLTAMPATDGSSLRIQLYRRAIDRPAAALQGAGRESGAALLSRTDVEVIARFVLVGCNGELAPTVLGHTAMVLVGRSARASARGRGRRKQPTRLPPPARLPPFRFAGGGRLPVPNGFRVEGTGFRAIRPSPLALPMPNGVQGPVLGAAPQGAGRGRILPVLDPGRAPGAGLFPFFYQDRARSFFARPVPGITPLRIFTARPPLVGAPVPRALLRSGRRAAAPVSRPGRKGRGRTREDLDLATDEAVLDRLLGIARPAEPDAAAESADAALPPRGDEEDAWEDLEDLAWHPEDAEAARSPSRRTRRSGSRPPRPPAAAPAPARPGAAPPARPPRPALTLGKRPRPALMQRERLRFVPFEHAQTCRLIDTLMNKGIDGLLDLATTRGNHPVAVDHRNVNGRWQPTRESRFQQAYRPGALVDPEYPRLDIDFDAASAYGLYNWELFFHAPLQVAIRLAKDGRHEEAQRWFHFIFDPTSDSSAPAPRRYWRFAPFHENDEYDDARRLLALLSYAGSERVLVERRARVEDQIQAWRERPFSPHAIARLRIAAYQKAVVMKYIDNLIEWGDKLFRRDTMESIQEATQVYLLAGSILGPRPERVPPIVEIRPMTFRSVRSRLDLFANWAVAFETSQVRRPFQIDARPDQGAAGSVLGMATLYFCVPPNPELDKKWDLVADRLFKIRNCMNIVGTVRQLALFEPPIDPGLLVRAAAAGVDLGSVIAGMNAPPPVHRYRFLVARAIALADALRRFGAATLEALERRDAERLAALRQSNETALLEAVRDVHKTRVKQVEEELAWLALQRDYVDLQIAHIQAQAQQLMIPQEAAKQQSMTAAKVVADVAEGIDLAAKVAYAIPEFQAGSAGGFSSPFVTVQMGGQMFGDIASAVAESMFKIMNRHSTEAEMAGAQAEYQLRQAELMRQGELLLKEKERVQKQIGEVQLKLEINQAELRRHELAVEQARKVADHLRDKFTNEELYGWMLGQVSGSHFQAYKLAFDMAKLAERALQFERGDAQTRWIAFSHWDSFRRGLLAGERLLVDLRRMEAAQLEDERRSLEVTRQVSLQADLPLAFEELLATGRCRIEIGEALLDGDFPGHYFRRIKTVSLAMVGPIGPQANVNCTLTLLASRVRISANASGAYGAAQDGDDPRFLVDPLPVQAISTSRPNGDPGMFQLRFDDDRYLPFEGAGAISTWRIELHQADNAVDLSELADLILSISYTAKSGGGALEAAARAEREAGLARGAAAPRYRLSLRRDLPEAWRQLQSAAAGQGLDLTLPLEQARLSGRLLGYRVGIEAVTVFARTRRALAEDALALRLAPPRGAASPIGGWLRPWAGSRTLRGAAQLQGELGAWTLGISSKDQRLAELLTDLVFVFELRARRSSD